MRVVVQNIDHGVIMIGEYFCGAAMGCVIAIKAGMSSPVVGAIAGGILIFFLFPPELVHKYMHWGLLGLLGGLNAIFVGYTLLSNGGGIVSLLLIVAPLVLVTFIASIASRMHS